MLRPVTRAVESQNRHRGLHLPKTGFRNRMLELFPLAPPQEGRGLRRLGLAKRGLSRSWERDGGYAVAARSEAPLYPSPNLR